MKKYLLVFSIIALFSGSSCSKEKLPKATQTGANTFGCKVNGKVFLPNGDSWSSVNPILVDNTQLDGFFVTARQLGGPLIIL